MTLDQLISVLTDLRGHCPGDTPVLRPNEVDLGGYPLTKSLADIPAGPRMSRASGHTCATWESDCTIEDIVKCPDGKFMDNRAPDRLDVWPVVIL